MFREVTFVPKDLGNKTGNCWDAFIAITWGKSGFYPKAQWWRDRAMREPPGVLQKASESGCPPCGLLWLQLGLLVMANRTGRRWWGTSPTHLQGFTDSLSLPPEELIASSHVKSGGARGGLLRNLGAGKFIKGVRSSSLAPDFWKAWSCKESAPWFYISEERNTHLVSDNKHQPFVSLEFVTCRNMLWQEKRYSLIFSPSNRVHKGGLPWGRRGI